MDIIQFFNSNFFVGAVTAVTAFVAWRIYKNKVKDDKMKAARVLVTEIRIADGKIEQMKSDIDSLILSDLPRSIFPTKSWKQYSHLFISDFDADELKLLNAFYDYGELVEEFAARNNDFFWVTTEERARVTVQKIAQFSCEVIDSGDTDLTQLSNIVQKKRDTFNKLMDSSNSCYAPQKTIVAIKKMLPNIPSIMTSSCGAKLKKLAKLYT